MPKKRKKVKVDQYEIDVHLGRLSERTKKKSSPEKRRRIEAVERTLKDVKPKTRFDSTPESRRMDKERQGLVEAVNRTKYGRPYPTGAQWRETERKREISKNKAAAERISAKNKAAVKKRSTGVYD